MRNCGLNRHKEAEVLGLYSLRRSSSSWGSSNLWRMLSSLFTESMSTDSGWIPLDFYFWRTDKHVQKSIVIFRASQCCRHSHTEWLLPGVSLGNGVWRESAPDQGLPFLPALISGGPQLRLFNVVLIESRVLHARRGCSGLQKVQPLCEKSFK